MRTGLTGKIIIVADGTGAIGVGIVKALLEQGATVIVPAKRLHELNWLKDYVANLTTGKLITLLSDMPDFDKAVDVVEGIMEEFGRIDLVVSVFDCRWSGPSLIDVEIGDWQRVMDQYVTAYFVAGRVVLNAMKEHDHGMFISIADTERMQQKPHSSLAGIATAMQVELTKLFAENLKGSHVKLHHLFINNVVTRDKSASLIGKRGWITPEMVGEHVIRLYRGEVEEPGEMFQHFLGKAVDANKG